MASDGDENPVRAEIDRLRSAVIAGEDVHISDHLDVNAKSSRGTTLLVVAAQHGKQGVVHQLLAREDTDVNPRIALRACASLDWRSVLWALGSGARTFGTQGHQSQLQISQTRDRPVRCSGSWTLRSGARAFGTRGHRYQHDRRLRPNGAVRSDIPRQPCNCEAPERRHTSRTRSAEHYVNWYVEHTERTPEKQVQQRRRPQRSHRHVSVHGLHGHGTHMSIAPFGGSIQPPNRFCWRVSPVRAPTRASCCRGWQLSHSLKAHIKKHTHHVRRRRTRS